MIYSPLIVAQYLSLKGYCGGLPFPEQLLVAAERCALERLPTSLLACLEISTVQQEGTAEAALESMGREDLLRAFAAAHAAAEGPRMLLLEGALTVATRGTQLQLPARAKRRMRKRALMLPNSDLPAPDEKPRWNAETGELYFGR